MEGFVFFIIFVIVAIVIPQAMRQARKADAAWRRAATDLGLTFKPSSFLTNRSMKGRVKGFRVEAKTASDGGKNSSKYTKLKLRFDQPLEGEMELSPEGFFGGVKKLMGVGDLEIGDPEFDDRVLIHARDVERARAFLTPERREHLLSFFETYPRSKVKPGEMSIRINKTIDNSGDLMRLTRHATSLAAILTGAPPASEPLARAEVMERFTSVLDERIEEAVKETEATVQEAEGRIHEWADSLEAGFEPHPMEEAGPKPTHEIVLDEAPEPAPPPLPEAPAEAQVVEEIPEPPAVESEPESEAIEPLAPDDPLAASVVCENLFRSGTLSGNTGQTFDREYSGKEVAWSGKLLEVKSYPFDFVFGSTPGVKATVQIHLLDDDPYGRGIVKAVVQLAADQLEALEGRLGEELAFRGTLRKADPYVKQVFVAEAEAS